ncbi:MAG TPA: DsbE family thiol:disulfide interchange protein [Caulobacteraceae bacterium]|nr:DsbE family thiol:disulfide interchange protein [Caulobacteraceae bacterium]
MKRLIFLAPIAFFGLVIAAFALGLGRDPTILPSTLIDKPLPVFDLPAVRSGDAGLKSSDGAGQPHLLNVFASWCVACRVEHPELLQLKAQGVPIDGLDWKDEPAAGAQYLVDQGDPYRLAGNDKTGRAGIDLGVAGVPETFLVDGHGRVRYKVIGPISPEVWAGTIKPLMDKLRVQG